MLEADTSTGVQVVELVGEVVGLAILRKVDLYPPPTERRAFHLLQDRQEFCIKCPPEVVAERKVRKAIHNYVLPRSLQRPGYFSTAKVKQMISNHIEPAREAN